MKKIILAAIASFASVAGCASVSTTTAEVPPFECTSIHPEVCDLERQFHALRVEQAEQNAAIQAAEYKRRSEQDSG
jgi:hypothetical protein